MVQSDLGGPKGLGLGRLFRSSCSEASPAPRHPNKDEAHASTLVDAVRLFRSSYSEASPAPRHPKMHEPNAFTPVDAVRLFRSACSEAFPAPRHPKEDEPHAPAPGDGRNQSPLMRADPKEEVRRKKGERASARPGGPRRWSEPQRLHRLQPCSGSLSTSPSWHSSKPPLSKPPQHCSQPLARSLSISHEVPRTGPLRRDWSPDPFSRARLRREEGESGACQGSGEGWEGKALEDMSPSDLVECMQAGIQAGKQCGTQSVTSSSMPSGGSQGVDLAGAATRLRVLARDSQGIAKKVVEAGALGPLSELLQSGDEEIVEQAATAILNIALHDRLRPQVVHHAGIIPALVAALGCPCAAAQSSAAAALCCMPAEAKEEIWGAGVLGPLLHILREVGDPTAKKDAAHCLFSLSLAKEHRSAIAQVGGPPFSVPPLPRPLLSASPPCLALRCCFPLSEALLSALPHAPNSCHSRIHVAPSGGGALGRP